MTDRNYQNPFSSAGRPRTSRTTGVRAVSARGSSGIIAGRMAVGGARTLSGGAGGLGSGGDG